MYLPTRSASPGLSKVYGIKLLNAREQLIKGNKISSVNESTGKASELPLHSSPV
jgi:hypothetical protein